MFIDELGPLPEEELHFKTEWFDSNACISQAAKIYEIEKKRIFLKKTRIPEIDVHSLKEGSSVSIFSRIFNIKSYSDDITRHVVMGYKKIGLVFQSLTDISEIIEFEKNATIDSISIGYLPLNVNPILNFDSTKLFIIVIGSRDQPTTADETDYITDPKTISHLESVELKMHHQKENVAIVILTNTLLKAKKTNIALTEIHNQLEIVCAKTMQLTREEAMTYLEIYAGVLPNITALVNALCGKECVIIQVQGENAIEKLREIIGPLTRPVAITKHKKSIRAKVASETDPGILFTEFDDDGLLETQYFFELLQ